MLSVWDLVTDKRRKLTGHILATSTDSDDFAATLVDEDPIITYRPAIRHLRKEFQDSDYQPPLGTVLVSWQTLRFPELVYSAEVEVLNRHFLVGDLVVHAHRDHQRGTVLSSQTRCALQTVTLLRLGDQGPSVPAHFGTLGEVKANANHVNHQQDSRRRDSPSRKQASVHPVSVDTVQEATKPVIIYDVDLYDLRTPIEHQIGDPVMYKNWAGIIRSTVEQITLRLLNNTVVVLCEDVRPSLPNAQAAYSVYHTGDMVTVKKADLRLGRWLFGAYDPNVEPIGVVVGLRTTDMRIDWQAHWRADLEDVDMDNKPDEYISVDEIESGQYTFYDMQHFTAQRSKLQSLNEFTSDPNLGAMCGPRVRFADMEVARQKYGSKPNGARLFDQSRAANLGFDLNVYDVVDSNSFVQVQWQDGTITDESTLDVIYADHVEEDLFPGDIVCSRESRLSNDGKSRVPEKVGVVQAVLTDECIARVRLFQAPFLLLDTQGDFAVLPGHLLGELRPETEDLSIYDLVVPLGLDIGLLDSVGYLRGADSEDRNDWLGHILQNHLDATYTVRLGASATVRNIRASIDEIYLALDPERIAHEDLAQQQDGYDEEGDSLSELPDDMDIDSNGADDDIGAIMMSDRREQIEYFVDGQTMGTVSDDDSAWSTDNDVDTEGNEMVESSQEPAGHAIETTVASSVPQYALLSGEVPVGHRFFEEKGCLSTQALRKVMKEHKMLSGHNSMPPGIFVRSWESHCNLLRALIIGPTDTPYAHCPFVFDIMLPENFPLTPPRFHFYHWTTGNFARNIKINPNLYEDGNVCLSLLNTWPGQEAEGWTPGQSTLLQALISVQSLILVPEPFYNEPGYEGKRDMPGTTTQSIAYNERVSLQTRGFLHHAIASLHATTKDLSLEGLEDVINATYLDKNGPQMLKKVIQEGEELVRKSRECNTGVSQKRDGMTILSKGACQVLLKTLASISTYLDSEDGTG